VAEAGRFALLSRLGITPPVGSLVHQALDDAISAAEARANGPVTALDAGCGRVSALRPFRARIGRLVGVDVHQPATPLPHLDAFAVVDLCVSTLEHFADPPVALANLRRWLRPDGTLVVTTVNRRHPFVAGYLGMPDGLRRRAQPIVKATAADAHPLVGKCNDPAAVRDALTAAGFGEVRVSTVGHLARAWGRHLPTFGVGLVGDLLAARMPSRRSTIVAVAKA
jgi:SAM-dependent methyltransferase